MAPRRNKNNSVQFNPIVNKRRIAKCGLLTDGSRSFSSHANAVIAIGLGNITDGIMNKAEKIRKSRPSPNKSLNIDSLKVAVKQMIPDSKVAKEIIKDAMAVLTKYDAAKKEINAWKKSDKNVKPPLTEAQEEVMKKFKKRRDAKILIRDTEAKEKGFDTMKEMKESIKKEQTVIAKEKRAALLKKQRESREKRKLRDQKLRLERRERNIVKKAEKEQKLKEKMEELEKENKEKAKATNKK